MAWHLTLVFSLLVWSRLTANVSLQGELVLRGGFLKKWRGFGILLHFRGCHPRGHVQASLGRDQLTDLHCVSALAFRTEREAWHPSCQSWTPSSRPGSVLCFTSFSEEVFLVWVLSVSDSSLGWTLCYMRVIHYLCSLVPHVFMVPAIGSGLAQPPGS